MFGPCRASRFILNSETVKHRLPNKINIKNPTTMTDKEIEKELKKKFKELWEMGVSMGFQVIIKGSTGYRAAREISNSRFGLEPTAVAFPKTAEHVKTCMQFCQQREIEFRVRSGGHQHEGMSSLKLGLMIRLSEMNQIEYESGAHETAWIPVGKPLQDIYDELQLHGKTIPGGGCWGVNVGGLTLGGGWGTSIRKMGLTCDNFDQAEVVLANGEIVQAKADNEYSDLFWALRGGGGGNFGIVTRFLFRLSDIGPRISTCRLQWKMPKDEAGKQKLLELIKLYMKEQSDFPAELTTVMSFRAEHKDMATYYPIAIIGKYYGGVEKLYPLMGSFMGKLAPDEVSFFPKIKEPYDPFAMPTLEGSHSFGLLSDVINEFVDGYTIGGSVEELMGNATMSKGDYQKKSPPSVTCLKPLPHKISSGYPKSVDVYDALAEKMFRIIQKKDRQDQIHEGVRLYMVLHGMPGKLSNIKPDESAFYFRDKEFLVQFQAWWENPGFGSENKLNGKFEKEWKAYHDDEQEYIQWIRDARKGLSNELEGAFINFVDREVPTQEYYGDNYDRLKEIKRKYDSGNLFSFPMSIPVK